MPKKFKFKLEGLLKVREFKEKKIKIELGELLKEMNDVEDRIRVLKDEIAQTYEAQEAFVAEPAAGRMIQFFPAFIEAKNNDIKNNENLLYSLKRKYDEKVQEMSKAKGDVKIMENFKEKKKTEHYKEIEKKLLEAIEEHTMAKKFREKGENL
ncbi:hypothetical protein HBN50_06055 [Halobacteriovorax sp. GB3]|uniref:hypothetical protein n=1 Tax=Halobacteriovorax sp. GB3 TaxID=2719615 RepID=UPI0023631291|nr:hypothetical protein [Halobacteriovorax sp. GB3]MDD0852650.1 hypothetical protein [Halobacteriovorax sp. GB3]